jgi:acyl transferase domain-containing protein
MFANLFLALAPVQSLAPLQNADELFNRRVTPEARVFKSASRSVVYIQTNGEHAVGRDIFGRMVKVDFASHSPQMEPLRADLLQALEGLEPRPEYVPIYSTVTGTVSDGLAFQAAYWARNLREPVLFSAAVQRLLEDGHDIFLEISPHPILLSAMQQGPWSTGHRASIRAAISSARIYCSEKFLAARQGSRAPS